MFMPLLAAFTDSDYRRQRTSDPSSGSTIAGAIVRVEKLSGSSPTAGLLDEINGE